MPSKSCPKQGFGLWIRTLHQKDVEIMLLSKSSICSKLQQFILIKLLIMMSNLYCLETHRQLKEQHYTHLYAKLIRQVTSSTSGVQKMQWNSLKQTSKHHHHHKNTHKPPWKCSISTSMLRISTLTGVLCINPVNCKFGLNLGPVSGPVAPGCLGIPEGLPWHVLH